MEDLFNQFYAQNNGKFVETEDSSNYAQCMDLIFKWLDFINIPRDTIRHLYAYQVWTMPFDSTKRYFDMIPNGPTNVPSIGDIPVFGQSVGYAGHISIAMKGSNSQDLVSFDQNWGSPKYSRQVTHTKYSGVMGWLHPKTSPNAPGDDVLLNRVQAVVNGSGTPHDKIQQIRQIVA